MSGGGWGEKISTQRRRGAEGAERREKWGEVKENVKSHGMAGERLGTIVQGRFSCGKGKIGVDGRGGRGENGGDGRDATRQ